MNSLETIISTYNTNNTGKTLIEALIGFFTEDPVTFGNSIVKIIKDTKSIPDAIFWTNFTVFLQEGRFNDEKLRKLAEKLSEDGNNRNNAAKIIYAINEADDPLKCKYIAWLTESAIHGQLSLAQYFRLVKVVNRLINMDLIYLSENVEKVKIQSDDDHIEDFLANGLIMNIEGGFAYTQRAYDLVEYGINYGKSVRRPDNLPERQVISTLQFEEIEQITGGSAVERI